jgi:hypothetical protein
MGFSKRLSRSGSANWVFELELTRSFRSPPSTWAARVDTMLRAMLASIEWVLRGAAIDRTGVENREDVGMLQTGGEAGFAEEAVGPRPAAISGWRTSSATDRSCLRSWAR